jgi:hypothetical protein
MSGRRGKVLRIFQSLYYMSKFHVACQFKGCLCKLKQKTKINNNAVINCTWLKYWISSIQSIPAVDDQNIWKKFIYLENLIKKIVKPYRSDYFLLLKKVGYVIVIEKEISNTFKQFFKPSFGLAVRYDYKFFSSYQSTVWIDLRNYHYSPQTEFTAEQRINPN